MSNGLVRRTCRLSPNAATVALENLVTGEGLLRSVRPEAWLNSTARSTPSAGWRASGVHNYLDPRWLDR